MTSKLIKKFHLLQDEYYDGKVVIDYKYDRHYGEPEISRSKYNNNNKSTEYKCFVDSLVNTFDLNDILLKLYNYEPNLYYMIKKNILGVENITPFTNRIYKHMMYDMTAHDAVEKYGKPEYWDVSQVTDYTIHIRFIWKKQTDNWNLHPSINRKNLTFNKYNTYYNHYNNGFVGIADNLQSYMYNADMIIYGNNNYYRNQMISNAYSTSDASYANHYANYVDFSGDEMNYNKPLIGGSEYNIKDDKFEMDGKKKEQFDKKIKKIQRIEYNKLMRKQIKRSYNNKRILNHR